MTDFKEKMLDGVKEIMNASTEEVHQGTKVAANIGDKFQHIQSSVEKATDNMQSIYLTTSELSEKLSKSINRFVID